MRSICVTFIFLLLALITVADSAYSQARDQPRPMSPEQSARLIQAIRPEIERLLGGPDLVKPTLLQSIVATSVLYSATTNLILYSPIHAVIIVIHRDPEGGMNPIALGFTDIYDLYGYKYDANSTSYTMLRYEYVPILIGRLIADIKADPFFLGQKVHSLIKDRKPNTQTMDDILFPVIRLTKPENVQCIDTLDRERLITIIRNELPDKRDEMWFDHMFAADIIPNEKGQNTILFINELTRRLHLYVPTHLDNGRCVPGSPTLTFVK